MTGYRTFTPTPVRVHTARPPTPVVPRERVESAAERAARALVVHETGEDAERASAADFTRLKVRRARLCVWPPVDVHPMRAILNIVAEAHGVPLGRMLGGARHTDLVRARQTAMFLARRFTGLSLPEIGRRMGGLDHTTVLHGERRVGQVVDTLGIRPDADTPEAWTRAVLAAGAWPRPV